MKEKTLIAAIVRPLPPEIHSQSMTFGSLTANGTPDRYFDGTKGDLWCEFKQLDAWPRDGMVGGVDAKKRGCYSPQQYAWMKRRWENGRNVWGVIGLPDGRVVLQLSPDEWLHKSSIDGAITRGELVNRIALFCTGKPHASPSPRRSRTSPRSWRPAP